MYSHWWLVAAGGIVAVLLVASELMRRRDSRRPHRGVLLFEVVPPDNPEQPHVCCTRCHPPWHCDHSTDGPPADQDHG